MVYYMKVTTIIPDNIISEIMHYAPGKTLTDRLVVALSEWVSRKKIKALNKSIKKTPLKFKADNLAANIRALNRKR
jgi:hypothetical protein